MALADGVSTNLGGLSGVSCLIEVTFPVMSVSVVLGDQPVAFGRVGVASPPDHLKTGQLGDDLSRLQGSSISLRSHAILVCDVGCLR